VAGGGRTPWVLASLVSVAWAAGFPLLSGLGTQRLWGVCAGAGYLLAGVAAVLLPRRWVARGVVGTALLGGWLVPYLVITATGWSQSEVVVVRRSARLLLHTGSPYLAHPGLVTDYNPYFPGMALFGLAGDPRLWFLAVFAACLAGSWLLVRGRWPRGGPGGRTRGGWVLPLAAVVASPLVALPAAVGGVDLPMIGLCCLGLAFAERDRAVAAGLALALACALKWTAWPAVPVALLLIAAQGRAARGRASRGRALRGAEALGDSRASRVPWASRVPSAPRAGATWRAVLRCGLVAVGGAAVLVVPPVLRTPGAAFEQVVRFPLGLSRMPTPAGSPLPGHLLASFGGPGRAVALALLGVAAAGLAAWLVRRPPVTAVQACDRLAAGLGAAFLLAPEGRFGYLQLPVLLVLWPRLAAAGTRLGGAAVRGRERGRGRRRGRAVEAVEAGEAGEQAAGRAAGRVGESERASAVPARR